VKKGVPDPTAWLNDTAMYLRLMFPSTMVTQNMADRRHTFHSWRRDRSCRMGNAPPRERA
jgi:hypothetical protein